MRKPLLYILWRDAVSEDEWLSLDEIKSHIHLIETVGVFVTESEDIVTVALNRDTVTQNHSCIMHIPRECIIDMHEVTLVKD